MPKLMIEKGKAAKPEFILEDGDWTIGRSAKADIQIKDVGVSREHCRLSVFGDEVQVFNLSKKGIRLDGQPLEGSTRLEDGMRLTLSSSTVLQFRVDVHATDRSFDSESKEEIFVSFIKDEAGEGPTAPDEDIFQSLDGNVPPKPPQESPPLAEPPKPVHPVFSPPKKSDPVVDKGKETPEEDFDPFASRYDPLASDVAGPGAPPTIAPELDKSPEGNEAERAVSSPAISPTEPGVDVQPENWTPLTEAPSGPSIIEPIPLPLSAGSEAPPAVMEGEAASAAPVPMAPTSVQEEDILADVWGSHGQPSPVRRVWRIPAGLLKLLVALILVVAVAGSVNLFVIEKESPRSKTDTSVYLKSARDEVAAEDFDKALRLLDRVERGDSSTELRDQARDLGERIKVWRSNHSGLEQARQAIRREEWDHPDLARLQTLITDDLAGWNWNQNANVERLEASAAAEIVQLHQRMQNPTARARLSALDLERVRDEVSAVKKKRGGEVPLFLQNAWPRVERMLESLLRNAEKRVVDTLDLSGLKSWPPDLISVRAVLNARIKAAVESEKQILNQQLALVESLADAYAQYLVGARLVSELDFAGIARLPLSVPVPEPFARYGEFAEAQRVMDQKMTNLRGCARQLYEMDQRYGREAVTPPLLEAWDEDNRSQLLSVMACDTLDLEFAGFLRSGPQGHYDQYLGIEDFHSFLWEVSGEIRLRQFETPFQTEMDKARAFFAELDAFLSFVSEYGEAAWQQTGAAEAFLGRFHALKARQENLVKWLVKRVDKFMEEGKPRSAIIAAGLAQGFSSTPELSSLKDGTRLRVWLKHHYRLNHARSRELHALWAREPHFKRAGIRKEFLAQSLPGTAMADEIWKAPSPPP